MTTQVDRLFFPTCGRLRRRVAERAAAGYVFSGSVWSFWLGILCQFLVFTKAI